MRFSEVVDVSKMDKEYLVVMCDLLYQLLLDRTTTNLITTTVPAVPFPPVDVPYVQPIPYQNWPAYEGSTWNLTDLPSVGIKCQDLTQGRLSNE